MTLTLPAGGPAHVELDIDGAVKHAFDLSFALKADDVAVCAEP